MFRRRMEMKLFRGIYLAVCLAYAPIVKVYLDCMAQIFNGNGSEGFKILLHKCRGEFAGDS